MLRETNMANSSGSDFGKKNRPFRNLMDDNGRKPTASPAAAKAPWGDADDAPARPEEPADDHDDILRRLRGQDPPMPVASHSRDSEEARMKADQSEAELLRAENEELHSMLAELKRELEGASAGQNDNWDEREKEYETLLEEKSEMIRNLHVKMQEMERNAANAPRAPVEAPADQEELLALSDELERERCQLEQERQQTEEDRRQLREDEDAMMRQMREMELQMAKERAELARQRNELQRLHSEIRHELELAQRDAAVNERLKLLQRRHREQTPGGAPGGDDDDDAPPPPRKKPGSGPDKGPPPGAAPPQKGSIMRRFFGGEGK